MASLQGCMRRVVGIIDLFFAREIAGLKLPVLLSFWRAIFGGFIHTPEAAPSRTSGRIDCTVAPGWPYEGHRERLVNFRLPEPKRSQTHHAPGPRSSRINAWP